MSDPLYQAEILQLAREGRALTRLDRPTVTARVDNPICGDRVTIDLAALERAHAGSDEEESVDGVGCWPRNVPWTGGPSCSCRMCDR